MTTERDVRSLGDDISKMILGGYTSFIEGIALQDEDLAWELADKYANALRDSVRATFAQLAKDASEGLMKPPKKKRTRRKAKAEPVVATPVQNEIPADSIIGAEELPDNAGSLLSQLTNPEDADFALENALKGEVVTNRSDGNREGTRSRYDQDNPTMRRIR